VNIVQASQSTVVLPAGSKVKFYEAPAIALIT